MGKTFLITDLLLLSTFAMVSCSDDGGSICDAARLESALASATSGDTVHIGACTITGAFEVPEGVMVVGEGADVSTLQTDGDEPALRARVGAAPTGASNLTIEARNRVGLLLLGTGVAVVEDVTILATRGVAVGAEDVTDLRMTNVTVSGPITAANAMDIREGRTWEETALIGMILADVTGARFEEVTVTGFAGWGVISVDSDVIWSGGGTEGNLGVGMIFSGGAGEFTDVALGGSLSGTLPTLVVGAIFTGLAEIGTNGCTVDDSEGLGLFQHLATVRHTDLSVTNNVDVAIWAQNSDVFELSGAGTNIERNQVASVVATDVGDISIRDANIATTELGLTIVDETGAAEMGDGIQISRPGDRIELRDLSLSENGRIGVLLDLGDGAAGSEIEIENVSVFGEGAQLGIVYQNGTLGDGWDDGVDRTGATAMNDVAFSGELPIKHSYSFDVDMAVLDIEDQGIAGVIGDCGSW